MAFALRTAFEDRALRIDPDPRLRSDLRSIKKLVTSAGNIRFLGESEDSHCDRFWAKALRHHAAMKKEVCVGAWVAKPDAWDHPSWRGGYTSGAGIIDGLSRFVR